MSSKRKYHDDHDDHQTNGKNKSGSEYAMSIEETNRIRIAAGLAPLAVSNEEDERMDSEKRKREEAQDLKEIEADEMRAELAERKKKRLMEEQLSGKSLGELLRESGPTSAAEWAERNKQILTTKNEEEQKKKKAKKERTLALRRARMLEQQDQDLDASNHLKGMKVRHQADQFEEGKEVILTLKDSNILTGTLGLPKLNKDEDELENVALVEQEKRQHNERLKKQTRYNAYSDDGQGILSHYDEEPTVGPGMRIGEEEEKARIGRLESIRNKLRKTAEDNEENNEASQKTVYNLSTEKKFASDFFTADEINIKKPKKAKKNKNIRKAKSSLDEDDDEDNLVNQSTTASTSSSVSYLPEPSGDQLQHHGSRSDIRRRRLEQEQAARAQADRDQSYLKALSKAKEKTHLLHDDAPAATSSSTTTASSSSTTTMNGIKAENESTSTVATPASILNQIKVKTEPGLEQNNVKIERPSVSFDVEDDDSDIRAALDRARRLALQQNRMAESKKDRAQQFAEQVRVKKEPLGSNKHDDEAGEGSGIVFTDTTEFCRGITQVSNNQATNNDNDNDDNDDRVPLSMVHIKTEMDTDQESKEKSNNGDDDDVEMGDSKANKHQESESNENGTKKGEEEEEKDAEENHDDDDDDAESEDDGKANNHIWEEPLLNRGVTAALQLAKRRGMLHQSKEEQYGRARDKTLEEGDKYFGSSIIIEHRDDQGRLLKPKEAFRVLSHKFHGQGPGKKKLEKRVRQEKLELLQKKKDTALQFTYKIQSAKKKLGQAFVVLDAGVGGSGSSGSGSNNNSSNNGNNTPAVSKRNISDSRDGVGENISTRNTSANSSSSTSAGAYRPTKTVEFDLKKKAK